MFRVYFFYFLVFSVRSGWLINLVFFFLQVCVETDKNRLVFVRASGGLVSSIRAYAYH
jgi:hypothetical protein